VSHLQPRSSIDDEVRGRGELASTTVALRLTANAPPLLARSCSNDEAGREIIGHVDTSQLERSSASPDHIYMMRLVAEPAQ
jgi:hypothetical protein